MNVNMTHRSVIRPNPDAWQGVLAKSTIRCWERLCWTDGKYSSKHPSDCSPHQRLDYFSTSDILKCTSWKSRNLITALLEKSNIYSRECEQLLKRKKKPFDNLLSLSWRLYILRSGLNRPCQIEAPCIRLEHVGTGTCCTQRTKHKVLYMSSKKPSVYKEQRDNGGSCPAVLVLKWRGKRISVLWNISSL